MSLLRLVTESLSMASVFPITSGSVMKTQAAYGGYGPKQKLASNHVSELGSGLLRPANSDMSELGRGLTSHSSLEVTVAQASSLMT